MARNANAVTMAQVLLHGPGGAQPHAIGWLSEVGDNLRVSFADDYVADTGRPTLSQLYRGDGEGDTKAILTAVNDERLVRIRSLPTWFSNLLPEGTNRERLAEQRGCSTEDELELLAAAGHDLSGAVEIVPAHDVPSAVVELHATRHLEPLQPNAVAAPMDDGFSVDGIQTKFSMVEENRHYVVRRGTEAGAFIVKLPFARRRDIVLNEGICYELARAAGIATAEASVRPIAEFGGPRGVAEAFDEFLLVKRFDRIEREDGSTARIHFEELTQALGLSGADKYKHLRRSMRALLGLLKNSDTAGQPDIDEFFRRWTAYALMGNTDAHSKNWGLIYRDGVNLQLAPAYDIVCVASYFDDADPRLLAHNRAMDVELRKWNEDDAEALAKSAGLLSFNRARRIVRETRKAALETWPALLEKAPDPVRLTITQRLFDLARPTKRPG